MDIKRDYPVKIRSLMEEVRFCKERNADLEGKIE
jgi:hypothetical protein